MKLIIALGNPGTQYTNTRHNTGFAIVNEVVSKYDETWQEKNKFKGSVAETTIDTQSVIFLKPQTFYNDSGQSVRAIKDFYKIANQDILVIHDELALPFGTIRTRIGGSDAGNNGIKSINAHIGEDYARIRVGIYNELREHQDDADFVLSKFGKNESELLPKIIEKTQKILADFVSDIFESSSYELS